VPLPPVVPARYVPGGAEPPPGDGDPPPRWPWVLVSVVAGLVLVAGVVLALVLSRSGSDVGATGRPAATAEPLLHGAGKRPVRLDSIPRTPRLEPSLTWDAALTNGPDGAAASTALRFLQAVRALDWPTAYGLCAPEVRSAARVRADRLATDPPTVVGAAFYGDELHGEAIAGGALLAVEPYPADYLVSFRVQLADATPATVTLWLTREYTVQDWN
jgi:hypothetical protein